MTSDHHEMSVIVALMWINADFHMLIYALRFIDMKGDAREFAKILEEIHRQGLMPTMDDGPSV